MEILRPLTSTGVWFFTIVRAGDAHGPDVVSWVKDRFRFWESPTGPDEFNFRAGVTFTYGRLDSIHISKLQIFNNGVLVQADAFTTDINTVLEVFFEESRERFQFTYKKSQPVERSFLSALEVQASESFALGLSQLDKLSSRLSDIISSYGVEAAPYVLSTLGLQSDPLRAKPIQPSRFAIERRIEHPFESNIFYAEAPLLTPQHLELLNLLEELF